ncbi:MAG: hypothetical protein ACJ71C_11665 [Nitrososphaeraceae archaeon]
MLSITKRNLGRGLHTDFTLINQIYKERKKEFNQQLDYESSENTEAEKEKKNERNSESGYLYCVSWVNNA